MVAVSARIEGELAELDPAEAEEMRESYGVEGSGLARLVRAAYDLLELITFFTAGEDKEAVARPLHRGATALEAAGTIHTEIMEAFIKAEVIGWEQLVEYRRLRRAPATRACCGSRAAITSSRTAT